MSKEGEKLPRGFTDASGWELEIYRALAGERESRVLQLGSLEEYFESLIRLSSDKTLSRVSFRQALRRVVLEWNPILDRRNAYICQFLDLLATYRPSGGVAKVIELLRAIDGRLYLPSSSGISVDRIVEKSLLVLEKYFPIAPAPGDDNQEFLSYLSFLRLDAATVVGSAYATKRILQLGPLGSPQDAVSQLIEFHDVHNLVAVSLSPAPPIQPTLLLGALYFRCLRQDSVSTFKDALSRSGGDLIAYGEGIAVVVPGRQPIKLDLPADASEDVAVKYMKLMWREADARGFKKLQEISEVGVN